MKLLLFIIAINKIIINFKDVIHGDWGLGPNPQSPIPNPHFMKQN